MSYKNITVFLPSKNKMYDIQEVAIHTLVHINSKLLCYILSIQWEYTKNCNNILNYFLCIFVSNIS